MRDTDSSGASVEPVDAALPVWMRRVGLASWYFIGFAGAFSLLTVVIAASRDITVPLLLGIVLAVVFSPLVRQLTNRRVPPAIAATLVVLLIVGVAVGSIVLVALGLADQGDELTARIDVAVEDLQSWVDDLNLDESLVQQARESFNSGAGTVTAGLATEVVGVISSAVGLVTGTILGLMVLYYLLKDGSRLVDNFVSRQPATRREQYRRIADDSAGSIRGFAKGRTILALMNGVVLGLAALILGIPLAFGIGLVNFVGAYIPYLGGFIGGAFAFLLAVSVGGPGLGLTIVIIALAANLILENALEPRLLGEQLKLHPLVVLLATVLGGLVAGVAGLILAAPLTAIGVSLYREVRATGFFD
ncbi:MAG: AI-2E family transporter [Acidimicrobiales bacterium]